MPLSPLRVGDFCWLAGAASGGSRKKPRPSEEEENSEEEDDSIPLNAIIVQITHLNTAGGGGGKIQGIKHVRAREVPVSSSSSSRSSSSSHELLYKTMDVVRFAQQDIRAVFKLRDYGFALSPNTYDVSTKRILVTTSQQQQQQQQQPASSSSSSSSETPHQRASRMLQNSTLPAVPLPCRQKERERIHAFIERGVRNQGSKLGLYISGLPGSGKTYTVREVVRTLQQTQQFDFVEINGLKVDSGEEVFHLLARHFLPPHQLQSARSSSSSSSLKMELDTFFRQRGSDATTTTVLLIDEMDQLVGGEGGGDSSSSPSDDALFQLFNFAQHANAGLVVLAIANTLDLNERVMAKIRSRMGEDKISFASYGREDIERILLDRVGSGSESVFERDAISFCALKTASTTGDIRRAMRVCNKALDFSGTGKVTVQHITQAWIELETSSATRAIRFLSPLEKLILISVAKLGNKTPFEPVHRRVSNVGQLIAEVKPCLPMPQSLMALCKDKLCESRLLIEDDDTLELRLGVELAELTQVMSADVVFNAQMKS